MGEKTERDHVFNSPLKICDVHHSSPNTSSRGERHSQNYQNYLGNWQPPLWSNRPGLCCVENAAPSLPTPGWSCSSVAVHRLMWGGTHPCIQSTSGLFRDDTDADTTEAVTLLFVNDRYLTYTAVMIHLITSVHNGIKRCTLNWSRSVCTQYGWRV